MATTRKAEAVWNGDLASGSGVVSAVSSGVFTDLPVTWVSRAEQSGGKTSPEELVASAHAACYCMALSAGLTGAGTPPTKLEVSATVTFELGSGGAKVTSSALTVRGDVPGVDEAAFKRRRRRPRMAAPSRRRLRAMSTSASRPHWRRGTWGTARVCQGSRIER